jgi:hypothetical protein
MKLVNARLCLDCEDVHDEQHCPVCGSESFAFMTRWVTPSDTTTAEASAQQQAAATRPPDAVDRRTQLHRREQVDAYRQILNPTPARRGRMVAGGALGLALIGVARMLWRATPPEKDVGGDGAPRRHQP